MLFKYTATSREDQAEKGMILASDEEEAKRKLRALRFEQVRVKPVRGIMGLMGRFVANIK